MMRLTVNIDTDMAAFSSDPDAAIDLIDDVANAIRDGQTSGKLDDYNGNYAGEWKVVGKLYHEQEEGFIPEE
jgi:hypothetical protein